MMMMPLTCRATRGVSTGALVPTRWRWLSTVPEISRPVLSRRVWQAHAQKLPKKPKVDKVKPDDKPWPRNVQIAGGVAACIFIPYTTVWLITSNPTLREVFGPYLPMDRLRKHFGDLEWDSQSYADHEEEVPEGFYQYPVEDSFLNRKQQATIDELGNETITANIYLLGDSQIKETRQVPGSVKANPQSLAELVGAATDLDGGIRVAVDFVDPESGVVMSSEMSEFDVAPQQENVPTRDLLKKMSVFSTWHYTPAVGAQEQENNKKTSDVEIDKLRLEYTVEKLENDLRDPNCTRDHDEMRAELKQARRDLSRLKWKRRLGL